MHAAGSTLALALPLWAPGLLPWKRKVQVASVLSGLFSERERSCVAAAQSAAPGMWAARPRQALAAAAPCLSWLLKSHRRQEEAPCLP